MAHTQRDRKKLIDRVRRIQGQLSGVARALEQERDCAAILQMIAASRGAINGLMAEVLEGHIDSHVLDAKRKPSAKQTRAAAELVEVIRRYLR